MTGIGNQAGLLVVLVAALMVGASGPVLRRLPEPEPELLTVGEPAKITYASLARLPFVIGCALSAAAASAVVVATLPASRWPPWLVLSTIGVLLAWIDARTTWLPWRLTWFGWIATLASGLVAVALGSGWVDLVRLVVGGLLAGLWYVLIYFLTRRRIGLGDVWLAPLLGAPAALVSYSHLYLALLLGSVVGGVHGLVLLLRGPRGGFPYAPSIVAGPFLALIVGRLLP